MKRSAAFPRFHGKGGSSAVSVNIRAVVVLGAGLAGGALLMVPLASASSHTASSTVLTLRYLSFGPLAVPRIAGTTPVRVPIYSKSRRMSPKSLPLGIISPLPGSPYVRVASSAVYGAQAPADAVMAGVAHFFKQRGYTQVSSGSAGGPSATESTVAFAASSTSNLVFNVTWYSPASGGTRYAYYVTQVMTPPRPKSTMVPLELVRLSGTISTNGKTRPVVSSNKKALQKLARALNVPHTPDIGFHCPMVDQIANVTLTPAGGRAVTVVIDSGCSVSINGVGFQDYPAGPIWHALTGAVGR